MGQKERRPESSNGGIHDIAKSVKNIAEATALGAMSGAAFGRHDTVVLGTLVGLNVGMGREIHKNLTEEKKGKK